MATITACIRKDKINRDGYAVVQIAVRHHQKTSYIPTDIKVLACDFIGGKLTKGSQKHKVNAEILSLINIYNERLEKIDNIDAKDSSQVKEFLIQDRLEGYHKLSECFDFFLNKGISIGTSRSYTTAYKLMIEYTKYHDINLESIDPLYIKNYADWLSTKTPYRAEFKQYGKRRKIQELKPKPTTYSKASINTYLAHLKAVINYCINHGWVTYKVNPFAQIEIKTAPRRENIISAYDLFKIKHYQTDNPRYNKCRDWFMLSFYLGGMNLADMVSIDYRNEYVEFERTKVQSRTNGTAKVKFAIIPEAREIIDKYIMDDGHLCTQNKSVLQLTSDFNYCIKCIAMDLGIEGLITFTSARKVFAQIGTDLGISDNYINYLMGHSMLKARGMLDPYSKMQVTIASEILSTICSMSEHPDKINEVFLNKINDIKSTLLK